MPPRMVANESGISDSEMARLALRAASMSSVISRARAATLLMTAERAAPTTAMMAIWGGSVRFGAEMALAISSTAPEFIRARETMRTRAMMTTAGWPKPWKAS